MPMSAPHASAAVPANDRFAIGEVARLTGMRAATIRYYERIGLLPGPARGANRYRSYGSADVSRLVLLRCIRALGTPLAGARALLAGVADARCVEVRDELLALVGQRLRALDQEIADLHALREGVERYQRSLAACQPDERETFSACVDLSCIAGAGGARAQGACDEDCCL